MKISAGAYDAEKRLVQALPDLRDAATSEELRHAFQSHFEETEAQVRRLDQIFAWIGENPKAHTCKSIKGILDESKHVIDLDADDAVRDAALIAAAQEAEHFGIALYGTLRTWAEVLELRHALGALEVIVGEKKSADALLTSVAATLNFVAARAD